MSAPLVVNTVEGACWTRREATRNGVALYAPEAIGECPEAVMATYAELAEHGIAGEVDVLPMPVGSEPLTDGRLAEIRSLDLLSMMSDRVAPVVSRALADLIAEVERLRVERHSTNEALSEAAEALREQRDRIADLEAEKERWRKTTYRLAGEAGLVPRERTPEPVEDPHDSPLHHGYRLGRDLPQVGGVS